MTRYEYKVIPAPEAPPRIKGVRSTSERYARGLQQAMNEMGAAGWDYVRCDRLNVTATSGILRKKTVTEETLLVFRRPLGAAPREAAPAERAPREAAPREVAPGPSLGRAAPPDEAPDAETDAPEAPRPPRSLFASRPRIDGGAG